VGQRLSDGCAAVLITTRESAKRLGLRPLARIHATTVFGGDPFYMLTGVIRATAKGLQRTGVTLADIDVLEVNAAFAPVLLARAAAWPTPRSSSGCRHGAGPYPRVPGTAVKVGIMPGDGLAGAGVRVGRPPGGINPGRTWAGSAGGATH
jgi:hypothetical protein